MKISRFLLGAVSFAAGLAVANVTFAQGAFGNQQNSGGLGGSGAQGVSSSSGAFGNRTLGGGVGQSGGGGSSAFGAGGAGGGGGMQNTGQIGQGGGAAGFQAQSFVGGNQQVNSALYGGNVQGMQQGGMQGTNGLQGGRGGQQGQQGLNGNMNLGQQRNQRQNQQQRQQQNLGGGGGSANSNTRAVRTSFAVDFTHPTVSTSKVATKLSLELTKSRTISALGPLTVAMNGRTAILQGTVATEHDRSLAERLVLLEPGVSQIQNELRVRSALPPTPEEQRAAEAARAR
jgi:hypothetical protein